MPDLKSFLNFGGQHIKLKPKEYLRVALILFIIMMLIVMSAMELKYFSNTFDAKRMVYTALLAGLVLGALLSYLFTKNKPTMELLPKFQVWVALLVLCALFMPPLLSFTNRHLSFSSVKHIPVIFVKVEGFYADRYGLLNSKTPDGYFIFILKENKLERLKTRNNPFPDAEEGQEVLLPVQKGLWGFEYYYD